MLNIADVLGISWSSANIIYDYIKGAVWWAIAVDTILLAASIFLGGTVAFVKNVIKVGIKKAIIGLSKKGAIAL